MTIRKTSILALLIMTVVPLLATCGRGAPPPKEDFIPPTVLASTPPDNSINFPVGDAIKIEFSEEMDPATINGQTILLTSTSTGTGPVSGQVLYGNARAVFVPEQLLQEGTDYIVTIRGTVTDKFGNVMGRDVYIRFTTQLYPSVRTTFPLDGAQNVPVSLQLSLAFSKQINPLTLNVSLVSDKTGTVPLKPITTTDTRIFLIVPNVPPLDWLESDTRYTAKVSAGVEDWTSPHPYVMQQDYIWSFTTGSAPDSTPPFVQVTDPDNGALDVSVTPRIQVVFSEALSSSSTPTLKLVTAGTITILCSRVTSTDTKYFDYFLPTGHLNYFKQYTAIVGSAGIMDTSGNLMTGDYSWTFTTVRASTTTSISVPDPVPYGNVNVTVTVASSAGTPTGSVTLYTAPSPTVSLTLPLNSSGVAVFTIQNPSVGEYHSLSAYYGQQGIFDGSEAASGFSVGAAGSSTTVASSSPTSTFGLPVTFTATVTPAAATGSVTFKDNGNWLGSSPLYYGTATFITESTALLAGSHTITAEYSGDGNYGQSTSPAITQTVNKAATTTAVGSSSNPSEFNASVTLTATVISASTVTTGTVTFKDGLTTLGTSSLLYGSAALDRVFSAGTHSITATYNGSANFAGSTSPVFIQNVNKAPTTTMITVPSVIPYSNVTVTVNVMSSFGTPTTGNVTLSTAPSPTMTQTLPLNSSGAAVFTIANPGVNIYHTLNATYVPLASSVYAGSVGSGGFTVGAAASTTTVASSSPTSTFGNSVTFTATVTPSVATGTVTFRDGGLDIGTGTLSSGKATFSTAALGGGSHTISAYYQGDGNYSGSQSPGIPQIVNPMATTTTVTSSNPTSTFGAPVIFTATVTPSVAAGTVTFYDNGTGLFGPVTLSGGLASFSTSALAIGNHQITVAYSPGNANYAASTSAAIPQAVGLAATQTFVTSTPNPSNFGALVTFRATVIPSTATGTVTFSEGVTVLGTGTLSGGIATYSTAALAGGTHLITANYGGDTNYGASISDQWPHIVNRVNQATLTVVATPSTVVYGSTSALSTTGGSGTGAVTYSVGISTGCTVAGSTLSVIDASGSCSVIATKAADTNYNLATSTPISVTLTKAAQATLTAVATPSTVAYGSTSALSTIGGSGTGAVTYSVGASTGCTVAGSTLSVTDASGSCSVIATKAADTNYNLATSAALPVTLTNAAQATLTAVATPSTVAYGSTSALSTTGGSGTGAVTYSVGASTGCTVAGSTLSVTDASGTCSVTATKAADANYNAATSAPISVTLTKINQATLMVVATPSTVAYGSTSALSTTGGSGIGAVTYSVGLSTGCTVAGSTLSVIDASGTCSVTATKASDANYNAATSAALPVTLVKANQAPLSVIVPSNLTYPNTAVLSTTGGSGTGAVTYSVGDSTACSVGGDILSVTNLSGTCNVTATKAADNNYNATSATVNGTVTDGVALFIGAVQGIGFGSLGALSFLANHKLFGNLFRRRRKQNGSRGTHPREDRRD